MRRFLVATCLIATICAYHVKEHDFNVQIDSVEYSNIPTKYKFNQNLDFSEDTIAVLKTIADDFKVQPRAGTEAIMNEYADKIFKNLQELIVHAGLDPTELPDQHTGFNYTLIITYHGELDLTSGWLMDISTIHRGGDVVVNYNTNEKYLLVTVPIAFDDLQFSYEFSAKIMGLGPTGGITGKVANIGVVVQLGFNVATLQASLDEFDIVNSGHISVKFSGNALVDWLLNLLTDVVTALLKPLILGIVEGIIRGALDTLVQAINDAVDNFLNPTTPAIPVTTPVYSYFVN